jgi:FAD binding domain
VTTLFGQAPANHLGHECQFSVGSPAGAASPWRQNEPSPGSTRAAAEGACGGALSRADQVRSRADRFEQDEHGVQALIRDNASGRGTWGAPRTSSARTAGASCIAAARSSSGTRHTATRRPAAGLTSAIHDAQNLCWKIAAVLADGASPALLDTYETERRADDERNCQRSLENALNHFAIAAALGLAPANSAEQNMAVLRRMLSGRPEDAELRSSALRAMRAQSMEFSELKVEYGYNLRINLRICRRCPRRQCRAGAGRRHPHLRAVDASGPRSQPDPRPSDRSGGRARRGLDRVDEHAGWRGELLRHASGDP